MSTLNAVRAALEGKFNDGFSAASKTFGNLRHEPSAGTSWVRMSVIFAGEERTLMTGGDAGVEVSGRVFFQIFTPPNLGEGAALGYAESIRDLFNESSVPVTGSTQACEVGTFGDINRVAGEQGQQAWNQITMSAPFRWQRT